MPRNPMPYSPLTPLHDLAAFLSGEDQLKTRLDELAAHAASVTEAATCSIMLLSEGDDDAPRLKLWASNSTLPTAAWNETAGRGESIAGRVLDQGLAIVIADITRSEFAALARRSDDPAVSFICAPITVEGRIIGVINLSGHAGGESFDASHLERVGIVAALIGKSVQVDRLQMLLRSRLVPFAVARAGEDVIKPLMAGSMPSSRIAKILAKSFYRELAAAGFEPGQIIEAASEIIGLISSDVARAKKHIDKKSK